MDFYQKLNEVCVQRGTTVTRLLQNMGISTSKGTAWKNGSTPNIELALRIANQLNVSVAYLLGETDKKNKPTPVSENELSDDQRYLIDSIRNMSDENVRKLRIIVEQVIAAREK